jgi:hypothetical protein
VPISRHLIDRDVTASPHRVTGAAGARVPTEDLQAEVEAWVRAQRQQSAKRPFPGREKCRRRLCLGPLSAPSLFDFLWHRRDDGVGGQHMRRPWRLRPRAGRAAISAAR